MLTNHLKWTRQINIIISYGDIKYLEKLSQVVASKNNQELTELFLNLLILNYTEIITKEFSESATPTIISFVTSLLNLITKIYQENPKLTVNIPTLKNLFNHQFIYYYKLESNYQNLIRVWAQNQTFSKSNLEAESLTSILTNEEQELYYESTNSKINLMRTVQMQLKP